MENLLVSKSLSLQMMAGFTVISFYILFCYMN